MENIKAKIYSMDTDLSEKFVITACEDSLLRLFTIKDKNMELLAELTGHTGVVTKAVFINQGELIASGDFTGKLIIWKLEGSLFVKRVECAVTNGPIYDLAVRYSKTSFEVFCGCDNGILKTVEFDMNFKMIVTEKEMHRYAVVAVTCNGHFVATGGLDSTVALISAKGVEYLKHPMGAINAVALCPSDDDQNFILAAGSEDGQLVFFFKEGIEMRTQSIKLGQPCYSLDWSRTGLVLSAAYGKESITSYIQGENGDYVEVPMEEVQG